MKLLIHVVFASYVWNLRVARWSQLPDRRLNILNSSPPIMNNDLTPFLVSYYHDIGLRYCVKQLLSHSIRKTAENTSTVLIQLRHIGSFVDICSVSHIAWCFPKPQQNIFYTLKCSSFDEQFLFLRERRNTGNFSLIFRLEFYYF